MGKGKPVSFELRDDFGNSVTFENTFEVREFFAAEKKAWEWLGAAPRKQGNWTNQAINVYQQAVRSIDGFEADGTTAPAFAQQLQSFFSGQKPDC